LERSWGSSRLLAPSSSHIHTRAPLTNEPNPPPMSLEHLPAEVLAHTQQRRQRRQRRRRVYRDARSRRQPSSGRAPYQSVAVRRDVGEDTRRASVLRAPVAARHVYDPARRARGRRHVAALPHALRRVIPGREGPLLICRVFYRLRCSAACNFFVNPSFQNNQNLFSCFCFLLLQLSTARLGRRRRRRRRSTSASCTAR
jgi:hypothetical protein